MRDAGLDSLLLAEPKFRGSLHATFNAGLAAYHAKGITDDPASWRRPAPLLADLAHTLTAANDAVSRGLAAKLAPYVSGSHRGLFDGPSTTRPDGHLVVRGRGRGGVGIGPDRLLGHLEFADDDPGMLTGRPSREATAVQVCP